MDLDILEEWRATGRSGPVSVTTLDRGMARTLEPRAPAPEKRLEAVEALTDAGVPAGVLVAPIIPGITDSEIEAILARAFAAGAARPSLCCFACPWSSGTCSGHGLRSIFPTGSAARSR